MFRHSPVPCHPVHCLRCAHRHNFLKKRWGIVDHGGRRIKRQAAMPSCLWRPHKSRSGPHDLGRGHNDTCYHVVMVQRRERPYAGDFLSASWEHVSVALCRRMMDAEQRREDRPLGGQDQHRKRSTGTSASRWQGTPLLVPSSEHVLLQCDACTFLGCPASLKLGCFRADSHPLFGQGKVTACE